MHVLVTADTFGGVWTYARELVTGLVRRGVQVTLISFGEIPAAGQASWIDGLRGVDYRPTAFRLEWMQEAAEDVALSSEFLRAVVREVKPDLLHFNQFAYGTLDVDLPRVVVAHSDVLSWWVAVHGEEPRPNRWIEWYRETVMRGLAAATCVVAPTHWMLDQVSAHYALPQQSQVIYNGRSPYLFNPHVTKEDYVLTVGRIWDAGKQASLLAQAPQVVPVYIVGAERNPDALADTRFISTERPWITMKGPQSEGQLRQLFSRAPIYAATSRYEPFGLAPLEAALSRCAIVANDIPSFREVWGDTAAYFRYNDAGNLADMLERLHGDSQLRATYANLAYNRARQRFTAERMAEDYVQLYQALVSKGAVAA